MGVNVTITNLGEPEVMVREIIQSRDVTVFHRNRNHSGIQFFSLSFFFFFSFFLFSLYFSFFPLFFLFFSFFSLSVLGS